MEAKDKVDPSDVNKTPTIIKAAKEEIGKLDILVCGECHEVFNYIEQFQEHKEKEKCSGISALRDIYKHEPKPEIWAFMIWKNAQFKKGNEGESVPSPWTIYQQWCKLNLQAKETWIIAAENIQSFSKISASKIQEVKNPLPIKNKSEKTNVLKSNSVAEDLPEEGEIPMSKLLTSSQAIKNKQINNRPNMHGSENDAEDESEEKIKNNVSRKNVAIKPKPSVNESLKDIKSSSTLLRKALRTGKDEVIEEAVVERILGRRINHRKRCPEYFIKWENYPDSENTWEPKIHLIKCPVLLEEFDNIIERKKMAMKSVESQLEEMESDNNRPQRTSKQKAVDQVKVWCGDISESEEAASGKRKSFSDYDSSDSFEKKMRFDDDTDSSDDEKPSVTIRRIQKPQSSINGIQKRTTATDVPITSTPKVVRVNQKQLPNLSSGVYIMSKTEGIIKLDPNKGSPGSPLLKVGSKIGQTHIKVIKKDDGVGGSTTKPILPKLPSTLDRKQLLIAPRGGKGITQRKLLPNPPSVKAVLKIAEPILPDKSMDSKSSVLDEDSDGLEELEFPTDLPLPAPDSPPGEFTLCPLTGRVLGETDDVKEPEDTTSLDTLVQLAAADLPDVDLESKGMIKKETEREEDLQTLITVPDTSPESETSVTETSTIIDLDKPNPVEHPPSPTSSPSIVTNTIATTVTDIEASIKPTAIDKSTSVVLDIDDLSSQPKTTEPSPQKVTMTTVIIPRPTKPTPPKKLLSTPSTVRQKVTTFQQRHTINRPVLPKPAPTTTIIHKVSPNRTKATIAKRFHEPLFPMVRRTENVTTYKPANVPKRIGNTTIQKTQRPSQLQTIKKVVPATPTITPPVKSTPPPAKPVPLSPTVINMPLLTTDEEQPASIVESGKNTQVPEVEPIPVVSTDTDVTPVSDLSTFNLNDSETPLLITGDDGTIYQVAGQNEEGQTILISEGPDGQQQCVIVSSECSSDEPIVTDEQEQMEVDQPLSINTETEPDGDRSESEVVAQIIKADPPSPGGTRKVVLMLPDGNLMMTAVTAEQYTALELDK